MSLKKAVLAFLRQLVAELHLDQQVQYASPPG